MIIDSVTTNINIEFLRISNNEHYDYDEICLEHIKLLGY